MRVAGAEEPRSRSGDESGGQHDEEELDDAAQKNERAEDEEGDGVGGEMLEAGVDERRERDAVETGPRARNDAVTGRGAHAGEQVEETDEPHRAGEAAEGGRADFESVRCSLHRRRYSTFVAIHHV